MCCPGGAVTAGRAAGRPRGAALALRGAVSAVFYGTYSFLRVLVNKGLLIVLLISSQLFPLPLIYVGNHLSGLSSISKLSLLMFTVLRKFTIPLTLLLEENKYVILSLAIIVISRGLALG
uniref:Solute carrier family 35 member D2 n=1 Tax=Gallus gallus TaxID=9031 RepID=A0A8V0Y7T6_CHICK